MLVIQLQIVTLKSQTQNAPTTQSTSSNASSSSSSEALAGKSREVQTFTLQVNVRIMYMTKVGGKIGSTWVTQITGQTVRSCRWLHS